MNESTEEKKMSALAITDRRITAETLHKSMRRHLQQATWRRNLHTGAALSLALSGGLLGSIWLAATTGFAMLAMLAWQHRQHATEPTTRKQRITTSLQSHDAKQESARI